jgi:hypothetical protein
MCSSLADDISDHNSPRPRIVLMATTAPSLFPADHQIYAADLYGSLFNRSQDNQWNVARLENILQHYTHPIPGVHLPMLYFGMYGSSFAWHLEDYDLCSIKYICLNLATYTLELQNNGTLFNRRLSRHIYAMLKIIFYLNRLFIKDSSLTENCYIPLQAMKAIIL